MNNISNLNFDSSICDVSSNGNINICSDENEAIINENFSKKKPTDNVLCREIKDEYRPNISMSRFNDINKQIKKENYENDEGSINMIKNQTIRNLTSLNNKKEKKKYSEKNFFITTDKNLKEKDILENQNIYYDKNSEKEKHFYERKYTHSFNISNNLRNEFLPNLNYVKNNSIDFNYEKFYDKNRNNLNNSNNMSIYNIDEGNSLKSIKFVKQKSITQNLLNLDRFNFLKQNSHFSNKSNGSNKYSVITFQNNILSIKQKDSSEFGNSYMRVFFYLFHYDRI